MFPIFHQRIAWKLFITYLLVIIVLVLSLAAAAYLTIPPLFSRHMGAMDSMMGGMNPSAGGKRIGTELLLNFRNIFYESLLIATLIALPVALVVSAFISQQIVAPLRAMMSASQRIAQGHFKERVRIAHNGEEDQPDELDQLALSFNEMAEKLEQIEVMRSQLIGDVSHELRTPLSAIKGSMEGLIDGILPPNAETFAQIHHEAGRLQRLVDDLQELSRVEAHAYNLKLQPVGMKILVENQVMRLRHEFEQKKISVQVEIPGNLPLVQVDEDRISQVLYNLMANALQYTPRGGKLTVKAQTSGKMVQVSVIDTGIGIPTEHLEHIFTRFYRIDKSRSRSGGGSGIGLTISRHLVEAHGGSISAESAGEGKGSTFSFTIPAVNP